MSPLGRRLTAALYAAVIALQIAYPLLHGVARDRNTIAVVTLAGIAALVSAMPYRRRVVAALGLVAAGGFAVEVIGVHTGLPFGSYRYGHSLGPAAAGVPLLLAPAWLMISWPAALAARRLVTTPAARILVGAWALAAWDLFLDPQMVAAGHWHWTPTRAAALPGVPQIPLQNYLGWVAVALAVSVILQSALAGSTVVGSPLAADRVPIAFYLWTYVSSVLALGLFLHLPAAAGWGALGMGVVAVPLLARTFVPGRLGAVAIGR